MTAAPSCKICSGPSRFLCATPNEHSRTRTILHYRCSECGLVFVGNDFDNEELGQAYSTLDQASYYDDIRVENRRKMQSCIDDLTRLVTRESRILDLGTGDGEFLDMLRSAGFTQVAGHEIPGSPDLSRFTQLGCTLYRDFDYSTVPSGNFDVVTLLDVAEHVPDPGFLFRSCHRMLADGGTVYLHTPVVTPLDRLMHRAQKVPVVSRIGRMWQRSRTSIFHLQNYSRAALIHALHSAGFSEITVTIRNELSWPLTSYVRVYLCEKQGLPLGLAKFLTPFLYPFLATDTFNANKAISWAYKREAKTPAHPVR